MKKIRTVGIWGDSVLKGIVYDEKQEKYVTCHKSAVSMLSREYPEMTIRDLSRFGSTAPKGESRLRYSIENGYVPDMAIIEFGGNDCDFKWQEVSDNCQSDHQPHISLDKYIDSMKRMTEFLRENGIDPVIATLPPISAERYFDWICMPDTIDPVRVLYWLDEKQIIYRSQERYSHAAMKLAYDEGVLLLDLREPMLELRNYSDYLCIDGIHPNEKGQQFIGKVLIDFFRKNIVERS